VPQDDLLAPMEDVAPRKESTLFEAKDGMEEAATGSGQSMTKADLLAATLSTATRAMSLAVDE